MVARDVSVEQLTGLLDVKERVESPLEVDEDRGLNGVSGPCRPASGLV